MHAPCLDSSRLGRSRQKAHAVSCGVWQKSRFWPSPVRNFPLESIWILRPLGCFDRHHAKKFGLISCSRTLSGVRTLAYGTWLRSLINALVSGLESIRALRSESSHGIMRLLCDDRRNEVQGIPALAVACGCTLLWIRTELPVHAPCLNWSRFRRSRQEAHTVSYGILRQVEPDL